MPLPVSSNTTCDIYRVGTAPPATPAVSGVPCVLQNDWRGGQHGRDRVAGTMTWTNVMLVDVSIDIRDAYVGASTLSPQDTVYIPDHTGTAYAVIFIEIVDNTYQRVYLDRQAPAWGSGPGIK